MHLATLVASGQMIREEAINGLKGIPYLSEQDLDADMKYFLKKMGITQRELDDYIARPEIQHDFYKSEKWFYDFILNSMGPNLKTKVKKWIMR